ncbi:MAG: hypothetical protein SFU56_09750 [Capsulimonadales bacterium]|nr:hypothetical protein [Capsulimonadales bacterium]
MADSETNGNDTSLPPNSPKTETTDDMSASNGSETPSGTPPTGNDPEFVDVGQKVVDIALGAIVVSGELVLQATKALVEHGPEILNTLEAKGRPVREQIDEWLKSGFVRPYQEAKEAEDGKDVTDPPSAEDEITALERRVRELEIQVSGGVTAEATASDVPSLPVLPDLDDLPANDDASKASPDPNVTPPSDAGEKS